MSHSVGLDVSVKSVSICAVEADGGVIARGEVSSDPDQIAAFLVKHAPGAERIVHESGILSIWLTRELEKRGLPILCIDARLAHKALSGRLNKSDRGDAEGLAHLARTGWFTQVHIRSETSERIRVLIGTRERLIKMRKDLEGHVRGVLKVFGICMSGVHGGGTTASRSTYQSGCGRSCHQCDGGHVNPIHLALCSAADAMDVELRAIARGSDLAVRLMTVPGVGPIVALAYIATLDDAARFKKSKDVGAFLGLTRRDAINLVKWIGQGASQNAETVTCGDCYSRRPRP